MDKGKTKREKGKVKKNDKDFSIVIVPHFSGNVKTLKITKLYSGIILAIAFLFVGTAVFSFCYASAKANENTQLKSNVSSLIEVNSAQQSVISNKDTKIHSLSYKDKTIKNIMNSFISKYRSITNRYLTSRSGSVLNRSGISTDRAFVSDLKKLKNTITQLKKLSDTGVKTTNAIKEVENKVNSYLAVLPTSWPTGGSISSNFGGRTDPISYGYSYHDGIDLAASYGASISAPGKGTVIFAGYDPAYGNQIMISHGYGITTMYGHTAKMLVHVGQKVKRGQTIGYVGSTGRSTGPHLHFRVSINGTPVNPLRFLN